MFEKAFYESIAIVMGVVAFIAASYVVGLVLDHAHENARWHECRHNLKQIGLALHSYHDIYGKFPPAHLDEHSWRVRLNPYMISSSYYSHYDFEKPWNSEWNHDLEKRGLPSGKSIPGEERQDDSVGEVDPSASYWMANGMWQCPSDRDEQSPHTNYLMLVGPHAFGLPNEGRSFADITDDIATTIAVAETASREIEWLEPKDLDVENMSFQINDPDRLSISSHHPDGANVVFANGQLAFLTNDLPQDVLRAMITIDGGEKIVQDDSAPGGYRLANESNALKQSH